MRISGLGQLTALSRAVKQAGGPEMAKSLNAGLRKAVRPALNAVRQSARSIPAKGPNHTGLRREIAKALTMKATGKRVTVYVNPKRMSPGKGSLPSRLDGPAAFRHPVFGDTDDWVSQDAHPWFTPVMNSQLPRVQGEIQQVCEDVMNDLARKVGGDAAL